MLHRETSENQTLDPEELFAFPLSPEQQRMWQADREQPGNAAYNAAYRWDFRGSLDHSILERTFNEIVRRHDILRTKFTLLEGALQQIVTVAPHLRIPTTDLSALPMVERDEAMDRLCAEEATRGFDLEAGPLIRVGLLRMANEYHVLMLTMHHIICDGWSIRLIMQEMQQIYAAFATGRESPLQEPALQYGDYVVWQRERIERGDFVPQLEYWKGKLAGYRRLQVPTDLSTVVEFITKSAITASQLSRDLTDRLKQFSNEQGGTMFSTALAALMTLLQGYTGETDIAIGSPVAGRSSTEVEGLIGLIVNHVVFRVGAADDPLFPEFARHVRDAVWQAVANQDIPFAHVLKAIEDASEPCPHPFYSINFVCHRAFGGTASFVFEFSGIRVSTIPSKSQGALYDLNFFLIERETGWRLSLEYNTALYSEAGARRMLEDFSGLLETIAADPDRRFSELLAAADLKFAKGSESGNVALNKIAAKAVAHNNSTNLEQGTILDASVTSYELPVGVTQERFWLLAKIAPNRSAFNMPASVRIVGPLSTEILERSLQFVVDRHESLRTTFKEVGGRSVQHIVADLKTSLQVSDLDDLQKDERDTRLQDLLQEEARRSFDLEHGPLFRARLFRLQADDHVLIVTLHHIVSDGWSQGIVQRELWSAYAAFEEGHSPSLAPLAIQYADFTSWQNDWLASEQAREHLDFWRTQLTGPLPILDIVNRPTGSPSTSDGAIETLQLSGDLMLNLKRLGRAENATTFMLMLAGFAILLARYSSGEDVTIGSPSANRRPETEPLVGPFSTPIALRLNLSGNPTLREVVRRATKVTLDAMDHVDLPFEVLFKQLRIRSIHGRSPLFQFYFVYQTAFLQPQQLRRLSVNPAPTVSVGTPFELQLVVIERPDGVRANLDYDPHRFDVGMIKDLLRYYDYVLRELVSDPDQPVANLNLPAGGQSAPAMESNAEVRSEYVAPRDSFESKLVNIWEEIFELPHIGIRDDFFDLGGQSIMAAQMISQIEKEFGKRIDLSILLVDRTIGQLAEKLRSSGGENRYSNLVTLRAAGTRPPLFCVHGGGGHLLDYRDLVAALPEDQPIFGLRASNMDADYQPETVEQLADKYLKEIQSIQKRGPYQICGLSFGGLVAYEIARQLAEKGEHVGVIALLDTGNWAHYRNLPARRMAQFRRIYILDRLKKYARNLARGRFDEFAEDARQFITSRWNVLLWKASRQVCQFMNRPVPKFARSNLVVFSAVGQDYTPKPYPGRLLLFRAEGRTAEYGDDVMLGWNGVARDGVVVHAVPGGHLTIMRKPQVYRLVEKLNHYLAGSIDGNA
jgi:thioesterase domain-containing protein/non-ribosomal peptide synthetase component F/acyl carrier protein